MGTWNDTLVRIASDLGVASYSGGPLELTFDGAAKISVEVVDGGATLAAHADLGAVDLQSDDAAAALERLLASNAPQYIEAGAVAAIDPVSGSAVLFRRFEDPSLADETLADELRQFAAAVTFRQDDLRSSTDPVAIDGAGPSYSPNAIRV